MKLGTDEFVYGRLRRLVSAGLVGAIALLLTGVNGLGAENAEEAIFRAFKDKSPEEIARYFPHPYPQGVEGLARALASHGKEALPLVRKLLGDTHAAMRRGAVLTLGELYAGGGERNPEDAASVDPAVQDALALLADMTDDPNPWVLMALGQAVGRIGVECPAMYTILVRMGSSADSAVRATALRLARFNMKDPDAKVRVAIALWAAPFHESNTPAHYDQAGYVAMQAIDRAAPALPAVGRFLYEQSYRIEGKMFADGAIWRPCKVIEAHVDTDAALDCIPGLCRAYSRIPGYGNCMQIMEKLLRTLAPRAPEKMRAAIADEKTFVAGMRPEDQGVNTRIDPDTARQRVADLEKWLAESTTP